MFLDVEEASNGDHRTSLFPLENFRTGKNLLFHPQISHTFCPHLLVLLVHHEGLPQPLFFLLLAFTWRCRVRKQKNASAGRRMWVLLEQLYWYVSLSTLSPRVSSLSFRGWISAAVFNQQQQHNLGTYQKRKLLGPLSSQLNEKLSPGKAGFLDTPI